jgi:ankyrin repeat protein
MLLATNEWDPRGEERCLEIVAAAGTQLGQPPATDAGGYTALHHAVRRSWIELEAALLEAGAPAEVAAADGQHPVHWAAVYGCVRALHLLAADGARLDRRDPAGCAPLLFAAHHGRHLNVHYLLHRGAPVNDCDAEGHTALHRAAARGHYLVCRELLDAGLGGGAGGGANVALRDGAGLTALHWAAIVAPEGSNKRRLLRLLLDRGADPEAVDGGGRTVPTHAEAYGFRRTAALLADSITDHHRHPRTAPRASGGPGAAFLRGAQELLCGGGDMHGGVRQGRLYVTVFYCSLAAGLAIYWVQLLPRTAHSVGLTLGLLTTAATEVRACPRAAGPPSRFAEPGRPRAQAVLYGTMARRAPGQVPRGPMEQAAAVGLLERGVASDDRWCYTCRIVRPARSKHCSVCDWCAHRRSRAPPTPGPAVGTRALVRRRRAAAVCCASTITARWSAIVSACGTTGSSSPSSSSFSPSPPSVHTGAPSAFPTTIHHVASSMRRI